MSHDLTDVTQLAMQKAWEKRAWGREERKAKGCGRQEEATGDTQSSTHSTRLP